MSIKLQLDINQIIELSDNTKVEDNVQVRILVLATNNKVMRSKVLQQLIDEMEKDPWYIKLRRWWRVKIWVYKCLTRKYWDKTYQGYIFKKK